MNSNSKVYLSIYDPVETPSITTGYSTKFYIKIMNPTIYNSQFGPEQLSVVRMKEIYLSFDDLLHIRSLLIGPK